jgi:pSer/pThr/pTyr-binding forkhead associated (FHA) protein
MPKLLVSLPSGEATHELGEDVVTVGRLPDNSLQIDDASVSSHHAQLTLNGTDYVLQDLGSTNGTRFNGKPVTPVEEHRLQDGDSIRFGSIDVRYASENAADQRPLPVQQESSVAPAETSVRPADFSNASPFQTKKKKKEPAAVAVFGFAIVALVVFCVAVASVLTLKPPV